jgi:glycosyltransferase involved in cell wall biosynthesis
MNGPVGSSLVSVIVPAWNSERTLLQTLQSAAAQTHANLEILIIDDGSTDRTAEIAAEFCACDHRARVIRKENGGLASARNRGIDESTGQ